MEKFPFISVIMPAYNRADMIGITLESFIAQKYPSDRFEIIVADNNSTDTTKEVVLAIAATSQIPVKYLFEPRQGVHFARNMAAKHARGDIFYYTDDDMIADSNLLDAIVRPFMMGYNVGTATGKILPKWEVNPPEWILTLCNNGLLSLNQRPEKCVVAPYNIGVFSCHQAIARDAFFKSGGFNPENTAGEWIGDGETGLNIKLKNLGYNFAYVDDSIIYHIIPPSRMTQKYLNKRLANQGNCDSYTDYRKYHYSSYDLYKMIGRHLVRAIVSLFAAVPRLVLNKKGWHVKTAYIFYHINRIKYDYRLIKDEKWRALVLKNDWL